MRRVNIGAELSRHLLRARDFIARIECLLIRRCGERRFLVPREFAPQECRRRSELYFWWCLEGAQQADERWGLCPETITHRFNRRLNTD